jgi:hypothetical protein
MWAKVGVRSAGVEVGGATLLLEGNVSPPLIVSGNTAHRFKHVHVHCKYDLHNECEQERHMQCDHNVHM